MRSKLRTYLIPGTVLAVLMVLIVFPVGVLVLTSFFEKPPTALHFDFATFTFGNYVDVVGDTQFLRATATTLLSAGGGTIGAFLIGSTQAWLVVRTDLPGRRVLGVAAILPMFLSPLVGAFVWDLLGSPNTGIINLLLESVNLPRFFNIYNIPGIILVFSIYYSPYVYLFVSTAFRNMDPSFEEASLISGASMARTMWSVTLRLAWPALLSSCLMVFVLLIQLFSVPAVLGPPGGHTFLAVKIWDSVSIAPAQYGQGAAIGVFLLVMTAGLVAGQNRVMKGVNYTTVGGKSTQPRQMRLGWSKPLWIAVGVLYVLIAVLLPYGTLLLTSFRRGLYYRTVGEMLDPESLGLYHYTKMFSDPGVQKSLMNTAWVGLGAIAVGLVIYFAVSYIVQRTKLPGRRWLDYLAVLPIAVPGLVMGLGYLWSWITLPVGVYGTLWILILAYVSLFAPQGVRMISSSFAQIHPELEESSRIAGASFFYTLRRVVAPLSRHALLAAGVLILILSVRELAIPLFLSNANTGVLAITLFNYWDRGAIGLVAALSVLQAVILLVLMTASEILERRRARLGVRPRK
ncbi:ABC transporter permease [Dactylosporangium sp. CA-233914]|uniref:ABC transporter permease n=1 Tax=Dactylosporangium sp. CA-233914 TaxID=3239934 RepID=UPI003D941461